MTYNRRDLAWVAIVLVVILITGAVVVVNSNSRTATNKGHATVTTNSPANLGRLLAGYG
jgi:hypothetical protein